MNFEKRPALALFYCQNTPGSSEQDRQSLEMQYGSSLRLFPIQCSGRLDPLHIMKALEEFADAAYVVTCPKGACRYFEGNRRASKRVARSKTVISGIGLEEERIGIIIRSKDDRKSLEDISKEIMDHISKIPPSPVFQKVI